jgi:hypothetical protein
MKRMASVLAAGLVLLSSAAWAAAPAEIEVQGLYEGTAKGANGETKLEVRVVGQGEGRFKVLVRQFLGDDKIARAELTARTAGDEVAITGKAGDAEWKGTYAAGAFKGECGAGLTFEIKKIDRKSPTLGKKPPEGAIIMLGEKGVEKMVRANNAEWYLGDMSKHGWPVWEVPTYIMTEKDPPEWPTPEKPLPAGWTLSKERRRADMVIGVGEDGSIQVPKGGMSSKDQVEGSFDMHIELMNPFQPKDHSQGRGNSGCYMPNGDEIQVLDSFGECTYTGGGATGFYKYHDPHCMEVIESIGNKSENKFTLASNPPGTWQTYDIEYRVEKKDGKYVGKPHVTVYHNGIKVHENCEMKNDAHKGGFHFQDHGNAVRYRNIWVMPLPEK